MCQKKERQIENKEDKTESKIVVGRKKNQSETVREQKGGDKGKVKW